MMTETPLKDLYRKAYDPETMDMGEEGTKAAVTLRDLDLRGQGDRLATSPIERAFFVLGQDMDEANYRATQLENELYAPVKGPVRKFVENRRALVGAGFSTGFAVASTLLYALS